MKISWMPKALRDMNEMYAYYEKKDPKAAAKMYNNILDIVDLFATNPYLGAIEPLICKSRKTYRSFVSSNSRNKIIYYVEDGTVYIVRVWDCRQNPKKLAKSVK
ncbi:plasmid stabilization system protein ParE [Parabacteroides sp. PF5-6]|nr:plasmid stabilization system protein ParE [Parabacteroides sp. PF5-6]